jgi:hypothetical protein
VTLRNGGVRGAAAAGALAFGLTGPVACTRATLGEEVDTLSYFLSRHPETALVGSTYEPGNPNAGTHPLSLTVVGNRAYYVKWHPNAYEHYSWDDDFIYLREDRSWTDGADGRVKPHGFDPGRWMKRRMRVGEEIDMGQNHMQLVYRGDCRPGRRSPLGYKAVLEARIPRFDAGGDLGLQDVIVLRYDYSLRTGIPARARVNSYEKFYYSREWGWIQWEYYQDDDLQKDPPALKKRFRSNRRAPRKLAPNLENTCNRARFVAMEVDGRPLPEHLWLALRERRTFTFTLQNAGASAWEVTPDLQFRLGLVDDDSEPWRGERLPVDLLRPPIPWRSWSSPRGSFLAADLEPSERVSPGASRKFTVAFVAPATPGDYVFAWRMLLEGAEWFGDATPGARVSVVAPRRSGPAVD